MTQLEKLKVYPSTGFLLPLPETGMWNYALENNHIKDIDHYLTQITERQDFSLNMTQMEEKDLKKETLQWLTKLNKKFDSQLDESKLLKTGGTDQTIHQAKERDKKKTLNYALAEGGIG